MAALAAGDEQPPLRGPHVVQSQSQDLAPAQSAEHHRGHHCAVTVRAQRCREGNNLGRGQDPRQRPRRPHQRYALRWPVPFPAGRQTPGTGLPGTSPRAVRNAYNPAIVDKRRQTVRRDTPRRGCVANSGSGSGSGRLLAPVR